MAKANTKYECSNCGWTSLKNFKRCMDCGQFQTAVEVKVDISKHERAVPKSYDSDPDTAVLIKDIVGEQYQKVKLPSEELTHLFGGGLTKGSVSLIAGEPGAGKSTIVTQISSHLSQSHTVLYTSGEESIAQAGSRIKRIVGDNNLDNFYILASSNVNDIMSESLKVGADYLIVDSIQTVYTPNLESTPGLVGQVRECGNILRSFSKKNNITTILIGHVTGDGSIAGPKVLEHIVDTVLQIEINLIDGMRIIRCVKNRFGSAPEMALFHMTKEGLRDVDNAVEFFLHKRDEQYDGTCIGVILEGIRPILVETQALVETTAYATPSRESSGFHYKRLKLIAAVLTAKVDEDFLKKNISVNLVGGLKTDEHDRSLDLPVTMAIVSSASNIPVPPSVVAIGEVALTGEIFPVPMIDKRINELAKIGFKKILVPYGTNIKTKGLKLIPVKHVKELPTLLQNI